MAGCYSAEKEYRCGYKFRVPCIDSNMSWIDKQNEPSSIVEVIEKNLMNPVSLNDLAYLSGRSLSTFKREFQAIYNEPTFQWIRNRRLEKAQELLIHSGLSVTDVCFATGFENIAHFSKVFKNKYGIPPSQAK